MSNIKLLEWERIKMFRCVSDPMIGPKPRNAFMMPDLGGWEAWFHVPSGSIYVVTDKGRRHLVGTGNWSSIELYNDEPEPVLTLQRKKPKVIDGQI